MLKDSPRIFINAALILCLALYVTGCAEASRGNLGAQSHVGGYGVALKWTGDDGLSISFKRAIRDQVKSSSIFKLSYYGNADIIIVNSSNVVPVFSEDNSISGFTYHVIVHHRVSSSKNMYNLGMIDGRCKAGDVHGCASHLLEVIQKRLSKR